MPFSEQTKLEVKQKAAFRCCRCQSIGVDVHHIIPEEHDGSNEIGNAAPLCPSCHDYFGDNPRKRKEITQMRDWWYEKVAQSPNMGLGLDTIRQIDEKVNSILKHQTDVSELKSILKPIADRLIGEMTVGTASSTASGIVNTVGASYGTRLGEQVYTGFHCRNCGTKIGLMVGSDKCPTCGTPISQR